MNAAVTVVVAVLLFGCSGQPQPQSHQQAQAQPPIASPSPVVRPSEIEIAKDNDTAAKPPKKAVNVKLKRSLKGEYGWDIVGTDVKEIIKTNRELQKEFPN